VFEYRWDPNNPEVLHMIVDALATAFKSGFEFYRERQRENQQLRSKPLN
jgi:hypothetical protein